MSPVCWTSQMVPTPFRSYPPSSLSTIVNKFLGVTQISWFGGHNSDLCGKHRRHLRHPWLTQGRSTDFENKEVDDSHSVRLPKTTRRKEPERQTSSLLDQIRGRDPVLCKLLTNQTPMVSLPWDRTDPCRDFLVGSRSLGRP